jgi:glucose-1-phosphatase
MEFPSPNVYDFKDVTDITDNKIKNIIFDFGNVLFDLNLPNIEKGMRALFGEHYETAGLILRKNNIFQLYETGGISTEEFVDAIRMSAPPQPSHQEIIDVWNSIFLTMPKERFEMLLQLRHRYKVFMLSNINDLHAEWIDRYMEKEHHITDFQNIYFDGVYYSHLIRLRKPDTDAYEYVLGDAEIKPEESVFIDDLPENIAGAERVGINGLLHEPGSDIVARMAPFLK